MLESTVLFNKNTAGWQFEVILLLSKVLNWYGNIIGINIIGNEICIAYIITGCKITEKETFYMTENYLSNILGMDTF